MGTINEFETRANHFTESLFSFLGEYEKANPDWFNTTFLKIFYNAVANLKRLLEDPEEKEITWDFPFVTLRYPVLADWEKVEPYYFTLTPEDLRTRDRLIEKFGEGFITIKKVSLFR
jgi:hypothetical protein